MPTVSVIVPAYNAERFISQAIDSVLNQTYWDYEIIVVNDGSTDGTIEVLCPYKDLTIYIEQENRKLPAARNAGVRAAGGNYLAFLDSDDLFLPEKLSAQVRYLDARPEIGLVVSGHQYIDDSGRLLQECRPWIDNSSVTLETILFGGLAPIHAVLLRREWFERVGGFDEQFAYCEDMDLWYRLALAGCPMEWVPAVVCQYRLHANNMSRSPETHFTYLRRALDVAFADSRMPSGLCARKAEIDAQIDLSEAARLIAGGWEERARNRVRRAITTNPALLAENGCGLAEIVVGLQASVWSDSRYSGFVVTTLADECPELSRTMTAICAKREFYTAFKQRQAAAVRRSWLEIVRQDPTWLFNRGGWSILRRSILK